MSNDASLLVVSSPLTERPQGFSNLEAAKAYADKKARTAPGVGGLICWEVQQARSFRRPRILYRVYAEPPSPPGSDPSSGVREPRRPRPDSSAGAIELELPN